MQTLRPWQLGINIITIRVIRRQDHQAATITKWQLSIKFSKVGQTSRSRSQDQNLWYHVKDLVTRNTHVQFESLMSSGLKVMAKVKVFQKWVKLQGQGQKL